MVLLQSGEVLAWGDNTHGQLGLAPGAAAGQAPGAPSSASAAAAVTPSTVCLPQGVRALAVACGDNHTLFVTAQGSVFACGANGSGQCGLPPCASVGTPTEVPSAALGGAGALAACAGGGWGHSYSLVRTEWGVRGFGHFHVSSSTALRLGTESVLQPPACTEVSCRAVAALTPAMLPRTPFLGPTPCVLVLANNR